MFRKIHIILTVIIVAVLFQGCVHFPSKSDQQTQKAELEQIKEMRSNLDATIEMWENAIDDPYTKDRLEDAYLVLQDKCRTTANRKGGFFSAEEKTMCEITKYPYEIFFNELYIERNELKKQLFDILTPGTAANDYYKRPSEANLAKLKNLFAQVHKYYIGKPYTWYRYYNKYLFSKSRLEHYKKEWEERDREYRKILETPDHPDEDFTEDRAEFTFDRLKKDCRYNNLAWCCAVNAFYLADDFDDYYEILKEEEKYAELRKKAGRNKEVVIFIHGLGADRHNWKKFPELLSREDIANPSLDRYFKVYVFRYDTVEDEKSVEGFRREFTGFVKDILRIEEVDAVNVVAHSFGGVTTLKFLVKYLDDDEKGLLDMSQHDRTLKLIEGYLSGQYKRPLKRFIGVAPSLSGSEMANIMTDWFKKEPPLYQRNLPLFRSGVPVVGDVQVMENQIGSSVNLTSFKRLDLERPLDPQYLVNFLSVEDQQKYTEQERDKLDSMNVKVLTVIGNPFNTMNPFKKPEDDGLVKCYSANLNHIYLDDGDGKEDIGYKKAQVRQVNVGHHQMTEVTNRNQQQYKYVVSYLTDNLIPQKDPAQYTVKNFLVIARVYPEYIDYVKNPSMCFRTGAEIYYTKDERYELPKINIHAIAKSPKNEALKTENAYVYRVSSNIVSGVIFFEGNVSDPTKSGYAVFEIKAKGYKTKYVRLKVAGGEVTYAPNLLMEKE